jgi:hypothetical protein
MPLCGLACAFLSIFSICWKFPFAIFTLRNFYDFGGKPGRNRAKTTARTGKLLSEDEERRSALTSAHNCHGSFAASSASSDAEFSRCLRAAMRVFVNASRKRYRGERVVHAVYRAIDISTIA